MKIIFDNNLSPHLAKSLHYLMQHCAEDDKPYLITSVIEKFKKGDIPDVELFGRLSLEGDWVFISGDHKIRSRPTELKAFKEAKLIGFFVSPAIRSRTVQKQMAHFLELWHEIESKIAKSKPGAMFSITTQHTINSL